jgi:hypothetical protein|tara:strand:- start:49 stop:258 length:210 start_codon:yes stop_codon:yes gene_type:complete
VHCAAIVHHNYKLKLAACSAKKSFFFASICRANTDPPITKKNPAMGFFWGVDQDYIAGATKKICHLFTE